MLELREGPAIIGQFTVDEIKQMGKSGKLNPNMEIRQLPSGSWDSIFKVKGLEIAPQSNSSSFNANDLASAIELRRNGGIAERLFPSLSMYVKKPKIRRVLPACFALLCALIWVSVASYYFMRPGAHVDPQSSPATVILPSAEYSAAVNPISERDIDAAIEQISDWSGISQERIRSMNPSERADLARKWLAEKLGKTSDEIATMPQQEVFDDAIKQLADKYGILYSEASRLADLQVKLDSGRSLSPDEISFLRQMNDKIHHNR